MIEAALKYVRAGFPVLPVRRSTKAPLTSHGVKDATRDEATVREWWTRHPEANIALPSGTPIGAFVIDIDPRNGGYETLADLRTRYGSLHTECVQITGGEGTHLLFRQIPGIKLRGKLGPGVDVLSDGRYFVVEPSIHAEGGSYMWAESILNVRPAEPPAWLMRLLAIVSNDGQAVADYSPVVDGLVMKRARCYLASVGPAISGKGGNAKTFQVACVLVRSFALPMTEAMQLFREWNETCDPQWTEGQLRQKLVSALRQNWPSWPIGDRLGGNNYV